MRPILEGLSRICDANVLEVIVVDGGGKRAAFIPDADVVKLFTSRGVLFDVIQTPSGRGVQLNSGAKQASGDVLLFLHADTQLPTGAFSLIVDSLASGVSVGAFSLAFDGAGFFYRFIAWAANLRARLTRIPFGDQAIFIRKEYFESMGGFPDFSIMEDVAFMKHVRSLKLPIALLKARVLSSPRRYQRLGKWRTTRRNIWFQCLFFCGVSPEAIYRRYYK